MKPAPGAPRRFPNALEDDVAEDVRGDDLVGVRDAEARGVRWDENQRIAGLFAREDAVEGRVAGVGDERLVPVDDQLVALLADRRRDRAQVGADVGLGETERADRFEPGDPRQPLLAQRLGGRGRHGETADALHREERVEVGAHARQHLADHGHRK